MLSRICPKQYFYLLVVCVTLTGCRTSPEARHDKFLKRGQELLAKKDYSRALLELRNAANAMPKDPEPHYQMGLAYLASGDGRNAVRAFQKATELNPKHAGAQLKLAEFMTTSQNRSVVLDGINRLQGVLSNSPENPEAINTLAIAEWKLGKSEDGVQRLEEALKKFPTHLESSVTLARMKVIAKDWKGAEEVLRKAVADAPKSALAELALAQLYLLMQQPGQAESELRKALQLDPKNGAALYGLGTLLLQAKRIDEAEQTFKRLSVLPEKAYKPVHALFLFQFGDREKALAEFRVLATSDPADRAARGRLVAAYVSLNRPAEAEKILATALQRNPKDADALLQRAEMRLRSGRADDAEKDLKQVVHFTPDSAAAHFALAKAYLAKGLINQHQTELQQVLRLNPANLLARSALTTSFLTGNQPKAALDTIEQAPEAQKKETLWIVTRNWVLMAMGNLQEAKAGVDLALEKGRSPEAVYQGAMLRFLQRDYAGTRVLVDELLKRDVADVRVVQLMMEAYAAQKDLSKGMDRLRELAAGHPQSAAIEHMLGQWCLRGNDAAGARKAFEKAKAIDPHFTPADLSLAQLDIEQGRNEVARQNLNTFLTAQPANIPALLLAARADDASGNRAEMIDRYRAVLAIDSGNLVALNNLAYVLASDNPDEALKFAQQAAEKAPDNPFVQDTLGWIYYRKGLYSMATRYLKTAVDKESTSRRQFHLGMSYLKSGDQQNGQKLVREALQKEPNLVKTESGW